MKKTYIFITITLIAAITAFISFKRCTSEGVKIERDYTITPTPNIITEVEKKGKWEFLSVTIEELIDTTKGVLFKDKLSAIYKGTLRYGIDCSKAETSWFEPKGDTLYTYLPEVTLLDDYFLDEAATKTVFETGSFSPDDRRDMRERAIKRILEKSETKEYKKVAQDNAKRELTLFLNKLGIKHIIFIDRY